MKISMCEQGSQDWHKLRRGVPTASRFDSILTPVQGKISAQANDYIAELLGDRFSDLYPNNAEHYTSRAMDQGREKEHEARRWYELETGRRVQQVGFCTTDDGRCGCSPDGLVYEGQQCVGGLELKCPLAKTQVQYLLNPQKLLDSYKCQVHGALLITGLPWWDLASYCPGLSPLIMRVEPDPFTEKLRDALEHFWDRYQAALQAITQRGKTL